MAWIRTVSRSEARGPVKRLYDEALARAGRIWNIVSLTGLRPGQTRDSMRFYKTVMFGESELSRAEREMLAVVVSRVNRCHY